MVSLLDLMSLICVAATIGGALGPLRHAQRGWFAYAFAIVVAGVIGFVFAWAMRSVAFYYGSQFSQKPEDEPRYVSVLFIVGMFVWVIAAAFLGGWLTHVLLRHL